jgi:hypothetical protein
VKQEMMDDAAREIARLLATPVAPEMPAQRARDMRQYLVAELRDARRAGHPSARLRAGRRAGAGWYRSRPLLAGAAGACAVGVAAAIAVSTLASGPQSPGTAGGGLNIRTTSAVTLLDAAAGQAARRPAPKVTDSEYMYIRSEVTRQRYHFGNRHKAKGMPTSFASQIWMSVSNTCTHPGLAIQQGIRTQLGDQNGSPDDPYCRGGVNAPTYRFLQSLPTNPRTLLNYIYAQTAGEGQSQGRNGEAFITIGDMFQSMIVPPHTAAALYRAAALIPGVKVIPHVRNALGQPGIAIAFSNRDGKVTDSYEWIFNPLNFRFIGEQESGVYSAAIVAEGFVARPGQLP